MSKRLEVKRPILRNPPSKTGVKLKTSKSYNIVRSKKSLAWYVAYNATPQEKKPIFPKRKWKCPSKFTLATNWLVAAGEESHEAGAQMHREARVLEAIYSHPSSIPPSPIVSPDVECESHDHGEIPIIPIIPIEEREGEDPALVNTETNPSTSRNPPVNNDAILAVLRSLEGDMAVAAAAAATVAAVMESKGQIDTELLIKLMTNPEMIRKLINQNGFQNELDSGTTSAPKQNSPCPVEPKPRLSFSLPSSNAIPPSTPNTPLHLPSSRPISVPEPKTQSHASLPITKASTPFNESSGSQVLSHARSAPAHTAGPHFTRSMSENPLPRNMTNELGGPVHAHFRQVRQLTPSSPTLFDNNEEGKRMIEKYGAYLPPDITPLNQPKMEVRYPYEPHTGIRAGVPLGPSYMGEIERRYGGHDASGIRPSTMEEMERRYGVRPSPISSTIEEMVKRYGVGDPSRSNTTYGSSLPNQHIFESSGTFHSNPSRPLTLSAPPPLKDFTYYKSILGPQPHGERHYELQNSNMIPTEHYRPNYQRPFMHPDFHAGYPHHPPMPPHQWRGNGMMEVPDAKRMRFCEPTWNNSRNWQ